MGTMKRKLMMGVVMAGLFVVGTWQIALAEKWQPYQFKGDERFKYKVTWGEGEEKREATYILDIKRSGERTKEGEDIFEVTYTTKGTLKKGELRAEAAFGLWSVYGISLNMLILNPAYGFFFSQMELEVGEKMSFFGAGTVKIIGKDEVAGREGVVCQLFQEDELVAEWTIDPELAMPLRSKVFMEKKVQSQIELTNYTRY